MCDNATLKKSIETLTELSEQNAKNIQEMRDTVDEKFEKLEPVVEAIDGLNWFGSAMAGFGRFLRNFTLTVGSLAAVLAYLREDILAAAEWIRSLLR